MHKPGVDGVASQCHALMHLAISRSAPAKLASVCFLCVGVHRRQDSLLQDRAFQDHLWELPRREVGFNAGDCTPDSDEFIDLTFEMLNESAEAVALPLAWPDAELCRAVHAVAESAISSHLAADLRPHKGAWLTLALPVQGGTCRQKRLQADVVIVGVADEFEDVRSLDTMENKLRLSLHPGEVGSGLSKPRCNICGNSASMHGVLANKVGSEIWRRQTLKPKGLSESGGSTTKNVFLIVKKGDDQSLGHSAVEWASEPQHSQRPPPPADPHGCAAASVAS
eukprot:CAMPEP_0115745242 /NCGR_PEP_ID=MMETSP0272-20121206/92020_1 /TAXON_ID=71861 /ORGANISM="Scrippsiella trochoidea, Strain CCMP3099" /LENGTH=280 /DNA_ID=CAMNT_0003190145 /DNA_START=424 /DNA_END=1263 /DNA_ORIENTATION=+